jgi:hypothetical protein
MKKKLVPFRKHSRFALQTLFETPSPALSLASQSSMLATRAPSIVSPALAKVLAPAAIPKKLGPVSAELINPAEHRLTEVTGTASRDQGWTKLEDTGTLIIPLPIGFDDRKVNAKTFKAMANRPSDTLFRKNGSRWDILDNDDVIDLADKSQAYKLGSVAFYS